MKLSWLFVIALLVFVAVFSVQNAEPMTVKFLTWQFAMSAALVIQIAALLGAIVGLGCGVWSRRPGRRSELSAPKLPDATQAPEQEASPIERHL